MSDITAMGCSSFVLEERRVVVGVPPNLVRTVAVTAHCELCGWRSGEGFAKPEHLDTLRASTEARGWAHIESAR